jgi:cell division protein ZapA
MSPSWAANSAWPARRTSGRGLLQAVSYLDRKMREIRDGGKVIGLERIAIMAALNITHDYLAARPAQPDTREHRERIEHLTGLLDQAMAQQDNLF